jgi:hypothetical protein
MQSESDCATIFFHTFLKEETMFHITSGRKSKLHHIIVLCTLLLLLGSFALPANVAAGGPVLQIIDDINVVLGPTPNHPCTGEALTATGDVLLMVWGPPGYRLHVNGAGVTMVGADSGNLYRFNGALNRFISANDQVYHSMHHFTWFSPGNGDAFVATFLSHTTYNADGTIVVEFNYLNGGCM